MTWSKTQVGFHLAFRMTITKRMVEELLAWVIQSQSTQLREVVQITIMRENSPLRSLVLDSLWWLGKAKINIWNFPLNLEIVDWLPMGQGAIRKLTTSDSKLILSPKCKLYLWEAKAPTIYWRSTSICQKCCRRESLGEERLRTQWLQKVVLWQLWINWVCWCCLVTPKRTIKMKRMTLIKWQSDFRRKMMSKPSCLNREIKFSK